MKLLHTGDWHIGKLLADKSRLEEQRIVLDELAAMADKHEPDVICITGDVYDNGHPSARAEELFCSTIKRLCKGGERLVVIIAGNHDQPQRLEALQPLAREHGILIFGNPNSKPLPGKYGNYEIQPLDGGVFRTRAAGEEAVFACVPYVSEKALGEVIYRDLASEEENLKSYQEKMRRLYEGCNAWFGEDTLNICLSHVFTVGYEGDSSERSVQLGGSYILDADVFPKNADYIALGHVHKPQKVAGTGGRARYCGSILPYHSDEVRTPKECLLVQMEKGRAPQVTPLIFSNPKPIERWECRGFSEAEALCMKNQERSCWVFLKIHTEEPLREDQIRRLKGLKSDLLEITPVFPDMEEREEELRPLGERDLLDLFRSFYVNEKNREPDAEILELVKNLANEEGEERKDEAANADDPGTEQL